MYVFGNCIVFFLVIRRNENFPAYGPVVRVLTLRSGDPRFKTRSDGDHSLNLILVVPGSTSQLHL